MINFSNVTSITTPLGRVLKIENSAGGILWQESAFNYVSFGDSIAAGHGIKDYLDYPQYWMPSDKSSGIEGWQYGGSVWGNKPTQVIANTYTDQITQQLAAHYGNVRTTSFARSGDQSTHLSDKLSHNAVKVALATADLVTVCIGANNVLTPALGQLQNFIKYGNPTLEYLEYNELIPYFAKLSESSGNYGSYKYMFKQLLEQTKDRQAKIVFTEVYNPLKYLYVDPGTDGEDYADSYFNFILTYLPNIEGSIDALGYSFDIRKWLYELEINVGNMGKLSLKLLTERINGTGGGNNKEPLSSWVERQVNEINRRLRVALEEFRDEDPQGAARISIAKSKQAFDSVPTKVWNLHESSNSSTFEQMKTTLPNYQQLVNCQICSGRKIQDARGWEQVFDEYSGVLDLAWDLIQEPEKAQELVNAAAELVIQQEIDVHPKETGHYVLAQAFKDALDIEPFSSYSLNNYNIQLTGGTIPNNEGTVSGDVKNISLVSPYNKMCCILPYTQYTPQTTYGYTARHWKDTSSTTTYSFNTPYKFSSNKTLETIWSNLYGILYRHTDDSPLYHGDSTGHQETYALAVGGTMERKLGTFGGDPGYVISNVKHGTTVAVAVTFYRPDWPASETYASFVQADVFYNGQRKANNNDLKPCGDYGNIAYYEFPITSNLDVDFKQRTGGDITQLNMKAWADCYITELPLY